MTLCASTGAGINKLWDIFTLLGIEKKKKPTDRHINIMDLKNMTSSKRNQMKKNRYDFH